MAQGDVVIFDKFLERLGDGDFNLSTLQVKCALLSGTVPDSAATNPTFGVAGTPNYDTQEVSGGGYTAGGVLIDGGDPWVLSTGTGTYTAQNAPWTSAGSGDPTNIRWGLVYETTNGYAICYVQVYNGSTDVSLLAGNVTIKWNGGATEGTLFTIA